jgi:mono/diheme cytochrome c family protein
MKNMMTGSQMSIMKGECKVQRSPVSQLMNPAVRSIVIASLALLACSSAAAFAANPDKGFTLAQRWCATCHLVDSDQKHASADVPPFAAIAQKSDFTPEKVAFFLLDPHPKMPSFPLSRTEAADIAAYIGSLRK